MSTSNCFFDFINLADRCDVEWLGERERGGGGRHRLGACSCTRYYAHVHDLVPARLLGTVWDNRRRHYVVPADELAEGVHATQTVVFGQLAADAAGQCKRGGRNKKEERGVCECVWGGIQRNEGTTTGLLG